MASDPPKVLISYSHDSPEHEQRVLELANRLRGDGIACTIDLYVLVPEQGWPHWMEQQIRESNFVLMVRTKTYYERVVGKAPPSQGRGVRWEGRLIYGAIYEAEMVNTKFIPILLESGHLSHIPDSLRHTNYYDLSLDVGYEDLYRRLTDQPKVTKRDLGKIRSLPAGERKSDGALGRLVNVPDLPPHFLPRPGYHQALKDAVLAGLAMPVALTGAGKFGLQGMGGIGKSVLAAALAHDSELETADRERYLDLAVFPEDQPIPEETLRVIWNLDEVDTRDCMTRLSSRSLATRSEARGAEALILHDLQRDLIHKRREKELRGLHLRLLEAWDALSKLPDTYV